MAQGTAKGVFGVKIGDRVHFKEPVAASMLDSSALLLRKELAQLAAAAGGGIGGGAGAGVAPPIGGTGAPGGAATEGEQPKPIPKPAATGIRLLRLRASVPWDKLSDFVRGVVMPLHHDGAELKVEVSLEATSESSAIKKSTLEQKVKETLDQIEAKILDKSEE